MAESKMPAMIWATCNGMSTRLPDGHRQFVGGWSEDKDRPRAEQFIRADLVEPLVEALQSIRQYGSDTLSGRADGPDDRQWQRESVLEMTRRARAALSSWEAAQ